MCSNIWTMRHFTRHLFLFECRRCLKLTISWHGHFWPLYFMCRKPHFINNRHYRKDRKKHDIYDSVLFSSFFSLSYRKGINLRRVIYAETLKIMHPSRVPEISEAHPQPKIKIHSYPLYEECTWNMYVELTFSWLYCQNGSGSNGVHQILSSFCNHLTPFLFSNLCQLQSQNMSKKTYCGARCLQGGG